MKLSSWAIRRPIPTIVLFLLLSVLGAVSFQRLPVNANPNVSFPIINISISRSGAAPDELENAVTRRVESAVAGMAGVRHITSEISDSLSTTTVEFQLHVDTDRAMNDVRNAIAQIRADLPAGIDEPLIERVDVEGGALAYYAVESPDMDTAALSWFVDDTVSRRLLAVPGVQQITRSGGSQREITVALRPERLEALGISITRVNAQLVQTSVDVPGGRLSADGGESSLRVPGSAADITALAATPIALNDGRRVPLGELADIRDGHGEIRSRARLNGREVVGFSVYRSKGTSDTAVADGVEQAIATLQAENPHIRIHRVHSNVDNTRENYRTAIDTLLEGAVLTVLVVFLFLRDWRATLVAAIALPLSILPAFLVMQLCGYTLNSVTLLGLTLVIGILVDDAIVEIENIDKHLMLGKRPYRAAIDAADAIGFAVIAITGTIVAVFLPVSFTGGMIGQYFSQFGTTVSAAVLASLLTARLATPLLAAYLLAPASGAQRHKPQSRPMRAYLALLAWTLRHRKTTLGLAALILAASFLLLPLLPTGFMPRADTGFSQLNIDLPPGSTLADTDATLRRLSDSANRHPAVARTYATAGRGGDVAKGELLIRLRPYKERSVGLRTFEQQLRDTLAQEPDIRFAFQNDAAQRDISIILTGNDPATLSATARTLKNQMQSIAGITNIQTNEPLPKNEQRIRLNAQEAARLGITPQAVGDLLRLATLGSSNSESARYNTHGRQITIRTILSADARNDAAQLQHLRVPAADGTNVPLHTIAVFHPASGSATISRFDRERRISVEADLKNGYTIGHHHRRRQPPARHAAAAARHPQPRLRRQRIHGRNVRALRPRDGLWRPDGVPRARPALPRHPPARHHPHRPAAVAGRGTGRTPRLRCRAGPLLRHRHPHADEHRHQKQHPPRGLHHRKPPPRHAARHCPDTSGRRAGTPHHHDHHRHGGGHGACRPRGWQRRSLPRTDGRRRHRRPAHLHRTEPHLCPVTYSVLDDLRHWLAPASLA